MAGRSKSTLPPLPGLECACASIRRAARLVTQLYSHEMGWHVEPAQFSLLTVLSRHPGASQAALACALGLDKTTLSRNLRLLEKNGWIELAPTADQRQRGYRLTPAGKKILGVTKSGWTRAQAKLRAALQSGEWETMMQVSGRLAAAAVAARQPAIHSRIVSKKRGKPHET